MTDTITPTILLILDGWGQAQAGPGNAVTLANTPTIDALLDRSSRTELLCSGRAVGLPQGFMGNSEVGHMNIGAGRVVYQDITRIDIAIEEHTFASNPVIAATLQAAQANNSTLHLIGLLSDSGVHSHINHLIALIDAAKTLDLQVAIHAITDGRDSAPTAGVGYLHELQKHCTPKIRIASLIGRYYAMDRDKRWERTQIAWDCLVNGIGTVAADPIVALQEAYANGETDEFIKPRIITSEATAKPLIADRDALFFFNFRADRARQISHCFADNTFAEFDRKRIPQLATFATMTSYDAALTLPVAFTKQDLSNTLGEVLSSLGYTQLRIAETEKYAHVTYFFNGGHEDPFPREERRLVPSPRDVATYDLKPQMSATEVTDTLLKEWKTGAYDFIVCNLANMDMVGHTGKIPAAIAACETVDACVQRILDAVTQSRGRLIITADHGNAEEMLTPEGNPQTAHSKNPVALVVVDPDTTVSLRSGGKLGDIAPTILHLWDIQQPKEMTGQSLLEK